MCKGTTEENEPVAPEVMASKEEKHVQEYTEEDNPLAGCGILGRYPIISVISSAAIGICIGIGLSAWDPEDGETKDVVIQWLGLVGDLFIRALKCIILPLVFINVAIAIVEMMVVGRAGSVGRKTIWLYVITTVTASVVGVLSAMAVQGLFSEGIIDEKPPASFMLGCNNPDTYITESADGSLSCTAEMGGSSEFILKDLSGTFVKSGSGPTSSYSLSDTVYDGVFKKLVSDNITQSFNSGNFAAVVVFAVVFGMALSSVLFKQGKAVNGSLVLTFFKEIEKTLMQMIYWIIMITPFAVISLISAQVGKQDDLLDKFVNVGYLVLSLLLGLALHSLIIHFGLWYVVTKTNPIGYLKFLIPAQTMAFASSSSAATLPMTQKCVKSTGRVPASIGRFVLPLGATVNMDGTTIYFTTCCIWLAKFNGIDIKFAEYVLLAIIASIGSAGSAPVPSGSLVLIITAYNTVFNTTGTPNGFEFIIPIDWFLGRMQTILNITGDAMVAGMVAHLCPDLAAVDQELAAVEQLNGETGEHSTDDKGSDAEA